MGITGLLPFVKNSCRPANIKDFSGSTVAIDAYSWLHKGAFSCAEKLVKGEKTDGYVHYCMKQLNLLLEARLRPIMVFDGCNLSSKEGTEKKRRDNREKTRQKGKELLCEGRIKEAREYFQRCVDVTPDMAREVIEACRRKSIDCIVAPYEADAQLAYLDKIGMAQLIITEDSDLILFGCTRIFFKMDGCGAGLLYEKEHLSKSFGNKALKFSFEKFRYMCILSGCDYLPSLHGIGLAKACKFFTLTNNLDLNVVLSKLPSYLKMPKLVVPKTYIESFIKANNTFLYQLVFCPQKKTLVPLNPYPEDLSPEDMEYAGKQLPDQLARELALGYINVKTMEKFEDSWSGMPKINLSQSLVWGSQQNSVKAPPKVQVNGFKFNTPKNNVQTSPKKRRFSEMVKTEQGSMCTDEELFSMYSSNTPKRSHIDNEYLEKDPLVPCSEVKKEPTEKSLPKTHPKILNIPFRKIVRSRFFFSDCTPNKDLNSSDISICSPEVKNNNNSSTLSSDLESTGNSPISNKDSSTSDNKCQFDVGFDSETVKDSPVSTSSLANNDRCEFTIDLCEPSPVKDNKENIIHRFAKKKVSPKENIPEPALNDNLTDNSPNKLKKDSWLDIIDEECNASTSTVSSNGKASKLLDTETEESPKPVFLNNPLKKTPRSKRLTLKKLHDFKWTKETKPKFNVSQDSGVSSCNGSFDGSQETSVSSQVSEVSPFFQGPSSCDSAIDLVSDSEDVDGGSSHVDINESTPFNSKSRSGEPKALKPLNNKNSKSVKCRTLGLSRNRKNSDKGIKKESLLNFNFTRQPKKEMSATQ
ncbi:hypothetical protein JTE90_007232 [Oedothorax gibbosus]|uniref:Exonuclease 1 n=1 Tax=Oedothorax gibbosus TaxID=931172 RepID=A0AAV6VP52_9ARAC|nr:hypothetical protein JTE90_007232 [Oedothorax gibbosus]